MVIQYGTSSSPTKEPLLKKKKRTYLYKVIVFYRGIQASAIHCRSMLQANRGICG